MNYSDLLESKIKVAEKHGISIDPATLHASLRDDQKDIAAWALELGAALIAPDAGCGKTRIGIEVMRQLQMKFGGKCLIVTELGASDTFVDPDPEVGEGAAMGVPLMYVTSEDNRGLDNPYSIVVTNYERVRMGNFDFSNYTAVWLDEGNYVKNMASETTEALKQQLKKVKYKYIATATPSPNEVLELVNYAHVLGICDRGQILTRFFQRNSTKAGDLTLHPHHIPDFWLWVSSWCIAIESPADLGYDATGLVLPKLNLHWVEVKAGQLIDAGKEKDGQARLFIQSRSGLSEAAKIARASIDARVLKMSEIADQFPEEHFIFWHFLEDERKAINNVYKGLAQYGEIYGKQDWEIREKRIVDFTKGNLQYLATKPDLSGIGCNFQKHCNKMIFVAISDSFDAWYQAMKRVWRFYNPSDEVDVWMLYTPEQYDIVLNLQRKYREHLEMREHMRGIIKEYGLSQSRQIEERRRSFMVDRKEWNGNNWKVINNDCVFEFKQMEENSIDMILTSIPFGNHYEYTDKYNDFGHNESNEAFFKQMDFLIPELLRTLKPGRIAAIHTKNRIHYGSVTGTGMSTFHRFTHAACDCFEKNGFYTMGFHYIPTDVVAENNQTYRLGFSEMCKDASKMGSGIPEEIWIFRKLPTSTANSYADVPVIKNHATCPFCHYTDLVKEFTKGIPEASLHQCPECKQFIHDSELIHSEDQYSLSDWQIDADSFWRSSGNRYLNPDELISMTMKQLRKWWNGFNAETIYDFEEHVKLLQLLDEKGKLSRTFTTLPLRSNSPHVWNDVNRMHGLNMEQSRRKQQNHICPMPFDQVDRLISLYSNAGDLVADPFGGLGTTLVRSVKKKRRAIITELNDIYASTAVTYARETEYKLELPTLFDTLPETAA
jgi:DNA modification methylase